MAQRFLFGTFGLVLLLAALTVAYQRDVLGRVPFGVHAWKQGDCLALAQRYLADGRWNLLDPRGRSLFSVEGRVNAELPLVPLVAARVASAVGEPGLIPIYRALTAGASLLGPLALGLLVARRTRAFDLAVLSATFLATNVVFIWYSGGFLPDTVALGLFCTGLWFLARRRDRSSGGGLVAALLPLSLAALLKMSFAVFLPFLVLAVLTGGSTEHGLFRGWWRSLTMRPAVLCAVIGSATLLVAQYLVLSFRSWVYAPTFFSAQPLPFTSFDNMLRVAGAFRARWLPDLLPPSHLVVLAASVIVLGLRWSGLEPVLRRILIALGTGGLTLVFLFGRQLEHHDYYLLASVVPVMAFAVAVAAIEVRRMVAARSARSRLLVVCSVVLILWMTVQGGIGQRRRSGPWHVDQERWLTDATGILEAEGLVVPGAVGVLGSRLPNQPLTILDRNGYVFGEHLGQDIWVNECPATRTHFEVFLRRSGVSLMVVRRGAESEGEIGWLEKTGWNLVARTERVAVLERRGAVSAGESRGEPRELSPVGIRVDQVEGLLELGRGQPRVSDQ